VTGAPRTVLHYLGYDDDAGGIVSVVRALAAAGRYKCVLGMNPGARQRREPALPVMEFSRLAGEEIGLANFWRARAVANEVRTWLREDERRVFHGHSRAGLLAGWWLHRMGERRAVVSVHCYGRQRWFYRWAAKRLGSRLFWLTPEMRRYYGAPGRDREQCLPGGVTPDYFALTPAPPVPGRLRLGGAGELSHWKRWDLVPAALARLAPEARRQVTFEHIGAPAAGADSRAWAAELRRIVDASGVAEMTSWRGPEASSHRMLSEIDLLLVTSHREPYSMILQEALAAGVPVLAPASGGPVDVVNPGQNGWLFRDGDAASLADVLAQQVKTREWATLDRAAIRQTARRAEDAAAEWADVYAGLD